MKKILLSSFLLLAGIILLQSCKKPGHDTQYVTLNESVLSGETYALNLRNYGDADDVASIASQAKHFTVSQIDADGAVANAVYHYSAGSKLSDKETVVINLTEHHDGNCGRNNNRLEAVITINFTIR